VVSNGKMVVYADDIALSQIIQSPEDYLLVQYDINAVNFGVGHALPTIWPLSIENVAISSFYEKDLLHFQLHH